MQCSNNLTQILLAAQNYASAFENYPAGVLDAPKAGPIPNLPVGHHYGWMTQILPFIEEENAFNKINFETGVYHAANETVRSVSISTFLCPSSPRFGRSQSSYAGCHHDVEAPIAADNHGVYFLNSFLRYDDIPDGASNTIFFGEISDPGAPDLGWASGTRSTLRNTGTMINGSLAAIAGAAGVPLAEEIEGGDRDDPDDESAGDAGGGATYPPAAYLVGGFGSHHPGGANFAFGDGSVRYLAESISGQVYRLLGHRSDGELLSDDEF